MKIVPDFKRLNSGENISRRLDIFIDEAFYDKECVLTFITPMGKIFVTEPLTVTDGKGEYELPALLLDGKGVLFCQLGLSGKNGFVIKSEIYEFPVYASCDTGERPEAGEESLKSLAAIFTLLDKKSDIGHSHDDRYYSEAEADILLSGKSDKEHTHDDRYYSEAEADILLFGKSDKGHSHDERYYTRTEADSLFETEKEVHIMSYTADINEADGTVKELPEGVFNEALEAFRAGKLLFMRLSESSGQKILLYVTNILDYENPRAFYFTSLYDGNMVTLYEVCLRSDNTATVSFLNLMKRYFVESSPHENSGALVSSGGVFKALGDIKSFVVYSDADVLTPDGTSMALSESFFDIYEAFSAGKPVFWMINNGASSDSAGETLILSPIKAEYTKDVSTGEEIPSVLYFGSHGFFGQNGSLRAKAEIDRDNKVSFYTESVGGSGGGAFPVTATIDYDNKTVNNVSHSVKEIIEAVNRNEIVFLIAEVISSEIEEQFFVVIPLTKTGGSVAMFSITASLEEITVSILEDNTAVFRQDALYDKFVEVEEFGRAIEDVHALTLTAEGVLGVDEYGNLILNSVTRSVRELLSAVEEEGRTAVLDIDIGLLYDGQRLRLPLSISDQNNNMLIFDGISDTGTPVFIRVFGKSSDEGDVWNGRISPLALSSQLSGLTFRVSDTVPDTDDRSIITFVTEE